MDYQSFIFMLTMSVYYYKYYDFNPATRVKETQNKDLGEEYDFIVIGAGSAGCVVANRLTEIREWKVLLLEAGEEETIESQTPFLAYKLWGSKLDWSYVTTNQKGCTATNGRCFWPRGKVMGGSSSINSMIYLRGNKKDYDEWEKEGNVGWSYKEVLPYFKKSEDSRVAENDGDYHGRGGYLPITIVPYRTPLAEAYLQAGKELGYEITDLNGARKVGFMYVQNTGANGVRYSTNKAFLHPVRHRKNLAVAKQAFATKIIFNGTRANGVEFYRGRQKFTIKARKEVILSAGVINSPQLLMLSGVGPKEHLASLNIPLVADLPVGLNLHDHVNTGLIFTVNPPVAPLEDMLLNEESIMNYTQNSNGPLSSLTLNEALACINTRGPPNSKYSNLEVTFNSFVKETSNKFSTWAAMTSNSKPKSRGSITLKSSNPFHKPIINPNYFTNKEDTEITLEGLKFVYKLSQTTALQKYNSTLYTHYYSMCMHETEGSDAFFHCIVNNYSRTSFHPVGSCKMGPNPQNSVVDSTLKVHYIKNLRVVDSSIIPIIPSSNTNAPTIMIGEKAADIIKKEHDKLYI